MKTFPMAGRCAAMILVGAFCPLFAGAQTLLPDGPPMTGARMSHHLFRGSGGAVHAVGGHGPGFVALATFDTWSPGGNGFAGGALPAVCDSSGAADLADGRILLVGSADDWGVAPGLRHAQLFDPATGQAVLAGTPALPRMMGGAARMADGRVLVAGGWYSMESGTYGEVYDPAGNAFAATGPLVQPRSVPLVLPRAGGGAYVCGGAGVYGSALTAPMVELYDAAANTFAAARDELVPDEPGWQTLTTDALNAGVNLRRSNGTYAVLLYRAEGEAYVYHPFVFDPATGQFAKVPLSAPFPTGDYPIIHALDTAGDRLLLLAGRPVGGGALGSEFTLLAVDLTTGTVSTLSERLSVAGRWLDYSRALYLPESRQLLVTGGYTQGGFNTNFSASAATVLVDVPPSVPAVQLFAHEALELRFFAPAGHSYRCEYSETLEPGTWQALEGMAAVAGDNQEHAFFVSLLGRKKGREFYRLAIFQP